MFYSFDFNKTCTSVFHLFTFGLAYTLPERAFMAVLCFSAFILYTIFSQLFLILLSHILLSTLWRQKHPYAATLSILGTLLGTLNSGRPRTLALLQRSAGDLFDAAGMRTALKGHAVFSDTLIFVYYLYVSNK